MTREMDRLLESAPKQASTDRIAAGAVTINRGNSDSLGEFANQWQVPSYFRSPHYVTAVE